MTAGAVRSGGSGAALVAEARPAGDFQLEFEILLSDLSSRFINLPPGRVDDEIEEALRRVSGLIGVDSAVLWQWSTVDPDAVLPTHSYPAMAGPREFEPLHEEAYPWVVEQMRSGCVVILPSLDELPAEAAVDRESARATGIRSNLTIPLVTGGASPVGALAFNTLREERDWPEVLVKRLHLVSQVFANALSRKRADLALRESEENARATFEQAAVGIAHVSTDGRWLRVNDKLCAILGYPREELLRLTFQEVTHPDDLESDLDQVRRVVAGEIATYSMEKRYFRKDRSLVWANLTVSLVRAPGGAPRHFISVVEEITDRKRGEVALRRSEERLAAGADLAGLSFYEVDLAERVAFADDRFSDICGFPRESRTGFQAVEFWLEHLHPDDRPRMLDLRARLHDGRLERLAVEYRFLNPVRGERWIHHIASASSRDAAGRAVHTFGVLRDVTEQRRNEEMLRDLSRRLIRAHEEERALLARELHDDLTQRLAVLAIDVGRIEMAAPAGPLEETLRTVREGLVGLSEDVHTLAYQLHPSVLDELGLEEALRAECERFRRQGRFALTTAFEPVEPAPEKDQALCLFRVAQEALRNVERHAAAHAVAVELRPENGGLLLTVRDDGAGFDAAAQRERRSLGHASMRERVQLAGGTLRIESAPGAGTSVTAWVPAAEVPA